MSISFSTLKTFIILTLGLACLSTPSFAGGYVCPRVLSSDVNADQIVRAFYEKILDRRPDPIGFNSFYSKLFSSQLTVVQVALALVSSTEGQNNLSIYIYQVQSGFYGDAVHDLYWRFLNRAPESSTAIEYWKNQLKLYGYNKVLSEFASTTETLMKICGCPY